MRGSDGISDTTRIIPFYSPLDNKLRVLAVVRGPEDPSD